LHHLVFVPKADQRALGRRWLQQRANNIALQSVELSDQVCSIHAQRGNVTEVKRMLADPSCDLNGSVHRPNPDDTDLYTVLAISCWNGHADAVALLLDANVQVNKQSEIAGLAPLYIAASRGHQACVKLLCKHKGTDVNQSTSEGQTAVLTATIHGHADIIQTLVEAGAHQDHEWMGLRAIDAAQMLRKGTRGRELRSLQHCGRTKANSTATF
jgi:hypothetical protein